MLRCPKWSVPDFVRPGQRGVTVVQSFRLNLPSVANCIAEGDDLVLLRGRECV